ncbi:MAG: acyl-CoA dehydrogenase family protein [Nitrospirae bacterium]|nr:acyl-CoA dehydrogenase family protein [Nitrospirota bacterium]
MQEGQLFCDWSGYFKEEHNIFRQSFRKWVEQELAPHADEWEDAEDFPNWVFKRAGEQGFLGLRFPEDVGGNGGDYWYTTAYAEELPRCGSGGVAMALMVQSDMATPAIHLHGTPEQKKEFLTPAIKGERIAAIGVSEPFVGSDVANLKTTAKRVGGDYVINGSKTFITNGARADFITLAVRTGDSGYGGISLILFPTDTKGFQVTKRLRKVGMHASDTAELFFDNCKVPARSLLGEEGHGFYYIMEGFQGERLIAAVTAVAGGRLTWEQTYKYATERQAFGRPIGKFQVQRHRLVELLSDIECTQAFVYYICDLFNRGVPCVKEVSMAKIIAGELQTRVADRCLQVHGGYGYIEEYRVGRAWRDSRLITIGGGTTEIMKEIVGKMIGL